jgi:hypothetical protein
VEHMAAFAAKPTEHALDLEVVSWIGQVYA